jgi:hypothetical protein
MVEVTALKGFDHDGRRRKDDVFEASLHHARALKRQRLVSFDDPEEGADPSGAAGGKSSASRAGQASRPKTAKPSAGGSKTSKTAK